MPQGDNDLSRINDDTEQSPCVCRISRAFGTRTGRTFVTTIRNVETATHYNFLSEVPTQHKAQLRQSVIRKERDRQRPILAIDPGIISQEFRDPGGISTSDDDEQQLRLIVKQMEDGWNASDSSKFAAPLRKTRNLSSCWRPPQRR